LFVPGNVLQKKKRENRPFPSLWREKRWIGMPIIFPTDRGKNQAYCDAGR